MEVTLGSDRDIFTGTVVQKDYREGDIIWGCNYILLRDVPRWFYYCRTF